MRRLIGGREKEKEEKARQTAAQLFAPETNPNAIRGENCRQQIFQVNIATRVSPLCSFCRKRNGEKK